MSGGAAMEIGGRRLEITKRDKVFFPDAGLTKGDLVDYYARIADTLLTHASGRLVSMHRYPDGIEGDGFYQKDVPDHFPDWIRRVEVEKEGGSLHMLPLDEPATLVYLADQGCITPHTWLSRVDDVRAPDRLVVDLDPPGDDPRARFADVVQAARWTRGLLEEVGLVAFVQTSGSRGLHVHVPLRPGPDFDTVRRVASGVADVLAARHPDALTTAARKAQRGERIYLDVQRNAWAQTAVPPYAVRARPGAPVATPLEWDELGDGDLSPVRWTMQNLFRRLGQRDDPWEGMARHARELEGPGERVRELLRGVPGEE